MRYTHIALDCNNILFANAWKLQKLTAQEKKTGGIFGFFRSVRWLAEYFHTNRFLFCWDSKTSDRKKIFPGYKASRKKDLDPEREEFFKSLYSQANELRTNYLPRIGFSNVYCQEGKEADDIIANLVLYYDSILVVSSDSDLFQLLDLCDIWNPHNNTLWDRAKFHRTYGVHPEMWADVKAMGGCTSDDIPGVVGVGEKTAIKYITGNLKETTKAYKAIEESTELIERNLELTKLPIGGPKFLPMQKDHLGIDEFRLMCEELWFDSFLDDDFYWERFFEGQV